jgi:hypothetical protein
MQNAYSTTSFKATPFGRRIFFIIDEKSCSVKSKTYFWNNWYFCRKKKNIALQKVALQV